MEIGDPSTLNLRQQFIHLQIPSNPPSAFSLSSPLLKSIVAKSLPIQSIQNSFLLNKPSKICRPQIFTVHTKFQLSEILGGRGLCNSETGLKKELQRPIEQDPTPISQSQTPSPSPTPTSPIDTDNAFEKELLGLTGGFPGGEAGLKKFIAENPPPLKKASGSNQEAGDIVYQGSSKPAVPELPLFMPGMIVIVKNENNPYHMYSGIVQRVTNRKAGVLFEGGNWDRLITFDLDELERREKGPPMVNMEARPATQTHRLVRSIFFYTFFAPLQSAGEAYNSIS